jgi:hypothetical protein
VRLIKVQTYLKPIDKAKLTVDRQSFAPSSFHQIDPKICQSIDLTLYIDLLVTCDRFCSSFSLLFRRNPLKHNIIFLNSKRFTALAAITYGRLLLRQTLRERQRYLPNSTHTQHKPWHHLTTIDLRRSFQYLQLLPWAIDLHLLIFRIDEQS